MSATVRNLEAALYAAQDKLLTPDVCMPEQVVEKLVAAGCKGIREDCRCCPLVHWFHKELEAAGVLPDGWSIWVAGDVEIHDEDMQLSVALHPLLYEMTQLFDTGSFPELDLRAAG